MHYTLGNLCLSVEALDTWSAQYASRFFSQYHFTPVPESELENTNCSIRIRSGQPLPPSPNWSPAFHTGEQRLYVDKEDCYLNIYDSLVVIGSTSSRAVEVWIGETERARLPLHLDYLLGHAMLAALRRCSYFIIHAAGVVEPINKVGALIIGDSNVGKSTLTIQLARSGWHYLSDDLLALSTESEGTRAWGLRRSFLISQEMISTYQVEKFLPFASSVLSNEQTKKGLEPGTIFPNGFIESAIPRTLLFPILTGKAVSRLTRITPSDALARLYRKAGWTYFDTSMARQHLHALSRLAKQSSSFILHAGRDLIERTGRAAELLSPYVKE